MTLRGAATLVSVGLLILLAALVAGAVGASQAVLTEQSRLEPRVTAVEAARNRLAGFLNELQTTWDPTRQTIEQWSARHAGSETPPVTSLSGRLNLNTLSPFLLQNSTLAGTLKNHSLADFVTYRSSKGPLRSVEDYQDYFTDDSLKTLYTTVSLVNVNSCDEIMLEKLASLRTGNDAWAASLRQTVRDYRSRRQLLTAADWDRLEGAQKDQLSPLFTVVPELDVNEASPELLSAVLHDPDFKIATPDAALQAIVSARLSQPLSPEQLASALGVNASAPILGTLGTRTTWLEVSLGKAPAHAVVFVDPDSTTPPLVVRLIEVVWPRS